MKKVILKDLKQDHIVQEAFKFLRTNIQFCGSDKHVIMLTSCVSGEGKSDTSLSLAMSLAELGKQVILVDTDLRKSMIRLRKKRIRTFPRKPKKRRRQIRPVRRLRPMTRK